MLSLIRSGPRILAFASQDIDDLFNCMVESFDAEPCDLTSAFDIAREDHTIIFLAKEMKSVLTGEDILKMLVIKTSPAAILCHLISGNRTDLIDEVRTAPRTLIMRAPGDQEAILHQMHEDLGGTISTFADIISHGNENTTLIALTSRPLNHSVHTTDLYEKVLRLDGNHYEYLKELRMHALQYLNIGIANKDWNEIEIRIYDRYGAYKLHYDRLISIFETLEFGIVLGESWSKDYPRLFMSVEVYRVRFFTFFDAKTIKRILLGMEYLDDGTRMVDYDVYVDNKKISWTDSLLPSDPRARSLAGTTSRGELLAKLNPSDLDELLETESLIVKTRK